ncbi:MAG: TonB-dependent receptor [Myxococcota bacterium]|nr:TonB-dependent receptor [Myxococcota bacterium]
MEEFDGAEEAAGEQELTSVVPEEDPSSKYKGMEEILVTAQGGTQNLQDVGASVAAFDADYLEALGAQSIADISQFTPNLEIRTVFAASNPTLFIRGVGLRDFNANSSSAVAVYNDDIYMNSPAGQLGQLFDVQQVEVLRGPQGTLYGRNASAGAIRVITRKPSGDTNGYTKFSYGKYNELEAEAAMEVPLTDELSIRVSGRMRKRDGYTRNRCAMKKYSLPDGGTNPNTFHNLVHKSCYNGFTDRLAGEYFSSQVRDPSLPLDGDGQNIPGEVNPLTGTFYYPYYQEQGNPSVLNPWYYSSNVDTATETLIPNPDGSPIRENPFPSPPTAACLLNGGCSYLQDPILNALTPIATGEAPYYSNQWVKGQAPSDIPVWTNNVDNWAVRALIRWQPSDTVDWVLNVHGGMNRGDSRQFQTVGAHQAATQPQPEFELFKDGDEYWDPDLQRTYPFTGKANPARRPEDGDPYAGDYNLNGIELLNLYGTSLTGEINFGGDAFVFRTISGFEGNERETETNLDANPYPFGLEPTLRNTAWQVSQEFKLNWDDGDAWSAEGGVSYLYESLEVNNEWPLTAIDYTLQEYTLTTHYASAYVWLDWHPVDDFSITAGGRWNYEVKDMDLLTRSYQRNFLTGGYNPDDPQRSGDSKESISTNGPSGNITFSYKPTDDRLFFFQYARGYKGPHINGLVLNADQTTEDNESLTDPVSPEKVDSLEFGVKTSWFDNQLTLNGAVFYYDYQDIQIFQLRNSAGALPVNQLINAEDADIYGAEIEVRTQPLYGLVPESIDGLEIFLSFGWLNSKYTEFVNTISFIDDNGVESFLVEDNSGNRLINSPELAFAGYASWPLRSKYGVLTPRFDWTYKSQVFFSAQNNPAIAQDPLWLLNLRVGYMTPNQNVELAGWIRNVTDVAYRGDVLNLARFRDSVLYVMGEPRTYGLTLNVRF